MLWQYTGRYENAEKAMEIFRIAGLQKSVVS
jgi:hypothetical protein